MSEIQEIQGGFDVPPAGGAAAAMPGAGAGADSMALPSFKRVPGGGGGGGGPIELLKDVDLNVKH